MQKNKKDNLEYQCNRKSSLKQLNDRKDDQTYAIIGAAMEVHKRLGRGFLENVYLKATAIELAYREIAFGREVDLINKYREEN